MHEIYLGILSPVSAQSFEWAATGGASLLNRAMGIASDDGNFVYVVGSFRGTARFGSQVVHSKGCSDVFLVKYRTDGKFGSGVYFVRLQTPSRELTQSDVITK